MAESFVPCAALMAGSMAILRERECWRDVACDWRLRRVVRLFKSPEGLNSNLNSCLNDEDLDEERYFAAEACLKRADTGGKGGNKRVVPV
jgi:hypothetical protein